MYDFGLSNDQEQKTRDLHSRAVVVDGLTFKDGIGLDYPKDLERMRSGGISTVNYAVAHFSHGFLSALKEIERDKKGYS